MANKRILLLFFLFFPFLSFGFTNQLILRGGWNLSFFDFTTLNEKNDHFLSGGFNTNVAYRWIDRELGLLSYVSFGNIDNAHLKVKEDEFIGGGPFRQVLMSPFIKQFFDLKIGNSWHFYLSLGPLWSMKTLRVKDADKRVALLSRGISVSFGFEKLMKFEKIRPCYIEIRYNFEENVKSYLVDLSHFREAETEAEDKGQSSVKAHSVHVGMGFFFF